MTLNAYSVGVGVACCEFDFFGRVRSLGHHALEQYLAQGEAQRNAHLSLVAEVAGADLTQHTLDEQLALARQTLETAGGGRGAALPVVRAALPGGRGQLHHAAIGAARPLWRPADVH